MIYVSSGFCCFYMSTDSNLDTFYVISTIRQYGNQLM